MGIFDPALANLDPDAIQAAQASQGLPPTNGVFAPQPMPQSQDTGGVASMMMTPDDALAAAGKKHPWITGLRLLGATMQDMGQGLAGKEGDAVTNARADIYNQAMIPARAGLMQSVLGGGSQGGGQPPAAGGQPAQAGPGAAAQPPATDPASLLSAVAQKTRRLQTAVAVGLLTPQQFEAMKPKITVSPTGVAYDENSGQVYGRLGVNAQVGPDGVAYDPNDPATVGTVMPKPPVDGAVPMFGPQGAQGGVQRWVLPDGTTKAVGDVAQAQAQGAEQGKANVTDPVTIQTIDGPNGSKIPVSNAQLRGGAGGGAPAPQGKSSGVQTNPAGMVNPDGSLNALAFAKGFTVPHEGGMNPSDLNGAPTNFGINQTANPQVDVRKLNADSAAQLLADKYIGPAIKGLPAPMAALVADTAVINPTKAKQFLQLSGGDPQKYLQLRTNWMAGMVKADKDGTGAAKYAHAWATRTADLANLVGQMGGQQGSAVPGGNAGQPSAASPGLTLGAPVGGNQDVPAEEAHSLGLAPGRWQRQDGKLVQVATPPKADLDRVTNINKTVDTLQNLVREQQVFLSHNYKQGTAPVFGDIKVLGHDLGNPLASAMDTTNPDYRAMTNSEAAQTLMAKPEGFGPLRVGELPLLGAQTQSVAATGDVNKGVLHENMDRLNRARQAQAVANHLIYSAGNLNDYDAQLAKASPVASGAPHAASHGPQPGAIEGGYRFMGGDPGNPASWKKL